MPGIIERAQFGSIGSIDIFNINQQCVPAAKNLNCGWGRL